MDNTRDYARVSHSRQWSNYNVTSIRRRAELVIDSQWHCHFDATAGNSWADRQIRGFELVSRSQQLLQPVATPTTSSDHAICAFERASALSRAEVCQAFFNADAVSSAAESSDERWSRQRILSTDSAISWPVRSALVAELADGSWRWD